jgi:hypothetical protein
MFFRRAAKRHPLVLILAQPKPGEEAAYLAELEFLDYCLHSLMSSMYVRYSRAWKVGRKLYTHDETGSYAVIIEHESVEYYARRMTEQCGFTIIGAAAPADWHGIPKLNPCTVTYDVTRNGKSKHFDLSTT